MFKCPECAGTVILHSGEYVCSNCGLVIEPHMVAPNYVLHEKNEIINSTSKPYVSLGNRLHIVDGLGSYIDYPYTNIFKDKNGALLNSKKQRIFRKLKYIYSLQTRIYKRQTDYRVLRTLNRVSTLLNLPENVRDRAAYHYHKIAKKVQKSNHLVLIALSILLAIREYKDQAPITLNELVKIFQQLGHRVNARIIVREALRLKKDLNLELKARESEHYIPRIVSDLVNSDEVKRRLKKNGIDIEEYRLLLLKYSREILANAGKKMRGGRNPYIFAAASIYTASRIISEEFNIPYILTQKIVAEVAGVAEYSIRDHFCKILKPLKMVLKPQIKVR
ncbi:MAG: hypothetical protein ACTSSJ_03155 [Candidatus Odinarchaeia archaeon]